MSMRELHGHIGGKPSGGDCDEIVITNPATGIEVAKYCEGDPSQIDYAVSTAERALEGPWAETTPADRSLILFRLADLVEARGNELCRLETEETGKPLEKEMQAAELPAIVDALRFFAGAARDTHGMRSGEFIAGRTSIFRKEPLGVVGLITPWNYPLMLAVWKLAPALAAGCTVVLKPAPQTPSTALILAQYAEECGIPAGVINIVLGNKVAGNAITGHPRIRGLSVTGSTETGKTVMTNAAPNITRLTLELGGKSPVIVYGDADLSSAAETIGFSALVNTGQDCTAATRVYAEEGVYDEFIEKLVASMSVVVVGDPLHRETDVGPLISSRQRDRVAEYVRDAVKRGARPGIRQSR